MKIDRILSILQYQNSSAAERDKAPVAQEATRQRESEAVKLAEDFGNRATGDRADRVAQLKSQIETGTYQQPDSKKLAEALVRELF